MYRSLRRLYLVLILFALSSSIWAAEAIVQGDWIIQTTSASIEASTSAGGTSFGMYCQADQCMFYIHDNLRCQPAMRSPILMSGAGNAASLNIQCTQVNGVLFQILEPFNTVLDEIKRGGAVSFAVPLQNGTFGVSSFSLKGGFDAVKIALQEAGKNKPRPKAVVPLPEIIQIVPPALVIPSMPTPRPSEPGQPAQPIPGSKRLQDIMI